MLHVFRTCDTCAEQGRGILTELMLVVNNVSNANNSVIFSFSTA